METRPKSYKYHTLIRWTGKKIGMMTITGKPGIEVATPPEFKGHEGIWSPEDLYVASANSCLMTTFLSLADRNGLSFVSYECEAEGVLELVEGKFQMTSIVLKPKIELKDGQDSAKAKDLVMKAEANCLISNSMKTKVIVQMDS
ncbi:MAG: OsmC family protein [Nitrospiria bacterium]